MHLYLEIARESNRAIAYVTGLITWISEMQIFFLLRKLNRRWFTETVRLLFDTEELSKPSYIHRSSAKSQMTPTNRFILTLTCLWLLLSGLFKTQLIILGVLSVALVFYFAKRMRVLEHRGQSLYFKFRHILSYWWWLMYQILLSNIDVTKRVWSADLDIKPTLRRVRATPNTELGRVVYANSITLTPGTTAINFTPENDILVHALHEDSLLELEAGEMAARVRDVEPHFYLDGEDR
ncbi:MAG: multicomponent Na+:H+ antiporter subunit E [Granulosicoccus sp.]